MSGPVTGALAGAPKMQAQYDAFRAAAHAALGDELTAHVRHAVAEVHGIETSKPSGDAPAVVLAYARRMPFEHTAITDAEAAGVVAAIGEQGYVALSVVAALADAECRAGQVGLGELTG